MLDYLGYLASAIILVSLLMTSARKLRWINLIGAVTFAVYGFLTKVYPVFLMNAAISIINIYYLYKMYASKDFFRLLPIDQNSVYLKHFINYYQSDIARYVDPTNVDVDGSTISFYILRNVVPAGVFVANAVSDDTLRIDFDYVVPTYRDFKLGHYIFKDRNAIFKDKGYHHLITYTDNEKHERYLLKMGFEETTSNQANRKCFKIDLI